MKNLPLDYPAPMPGFGPEASDTSPNRRRNSLAAILFHFHDKVTGIFWDRNLTVIWSDRSCGTTAVSRPIPISQTCAPCWFEGSNRAETNVAERQHVGPLLLQKSRARLLDGT
jgi:hypothetical protein